MLEVLSFPSKDDVKLEEFRQFRRHLFRHDPFFSPAPERIPEATCFLARRDGVTKARCAALVNPEMRCDGTTPGLLGFFDADDDAEAVGALFAAIERHLRDRGFTLQIGPLNGSTWQSYRIALPGGKPFFLDVRNPDYYQALFETHGFATAADYCSSRAELSAGSFPRLARMSGYFQARGIAVTGFDRNRTEAELGDIHTLALDSFRHNFLYTPLARDAFLAQYLALQDQIDPRFVLLARNGDGRLVGFLFAIANRFEPDRNELVIKTLAAAPEPAARGIGAFLVEMLHRNAFEAGATAVYHALMHMDNVSAHIGAHADARICRRYRLYRKRLDV